MPSAEGRYMPWDGVRGPSVRTVDGRQVAAYTNAMRVDYTDIPGTMTAALTSRVEFDEFTARVMATSRLYWSLGIHDPEIEREHPGHHEAAMIQIMRAKSSWAVRSFRPVEGSDAELAAAERATGVSLPGPRRYRFEAFRWGRQFPDPGDIRTVLVEMLETAVVYVGGSTVLVRRGDGPWTHDTTIPTS